MRSNLPRQALRVHARTYRQVVAEMTQPTLIRRLEGAKTDGSTNNHNNNKDNK